MQFLEKLDKTEVRFEELTRLMADPAVIHDGEQYRKVTRAHSELEEVVAKYRQWKKVHGDLAEARGMLADSEPELRQMAEDEVARLEPSEQHIEEELKILLLPKDPNDDKNIV